ncbi:MAPEG family protein [Caulobacter sp.]|uniref:MAPEG family protein n=1 Tax=Caulobacter sp. TaxID=78 RepID=UPI002B4681CB|nr:MAPEG family protein [Caulobacter sp.]HJV40743.1 MAPEG family protein [Caulobacter sp.]
MAFELQMLGVAVLIGLVHLLWAALAGLSQRGLEWSVGPRDERLDVTGLAGRLQRAFVNFRESFALFAVAVLLAYLGGRLGTLTAFGAGLYVGGRIAFLPLYVFGVPWVRSIAWGVSLTGILLTLLALVV